MKLHIIYEDRHEDLFQQHLQYTGLQFTRHIRSSSQNWWVQIPRHQEYTDYFSGFGSYIYSGAGGGTISTTSISDAYTRVIGSGRTTERQSDSLESIYPRPTERQQIIDRQALRQAQQIQQSLASSEMERRERQREADARHREEERNRESRPWTSRVRNFLTGRE